MPDSFTERNRMNTLRLLLGCGLSVALLAPAALAQQKSWVGKTILTKKNDIKFGYTDDNGRQRNLGTLQCVDYRVLGDQGGWLKVSQNGVEGWFDKADAVLLEDAVAFFTARLREKGDDSGLYNRRAIAWELKGDFDIALKDYG